MKFLQVRIPDEKKALFSAAAERRGVDMSEFVIGCVDALLLADRRGERVALPIALELERRPEKPKR